MYFYHFISGIDNQLYINVFRKIAVIIKGGFIVGAGWIQTKRCLLFNSCSSCTHLKLVLYIRAKIRFKIFYHLTFAIEQARFATTPSWVGPKLQPIVGRP